MAIRRRVLLATPLLFAFPGVPAALAQGAQGAPGAAWRINLWREGEPGTPLEVRGRITDGAGGPVAGATVWVRNADDNGVYGEHNGSMLTNERGEYLLRTVYPGSYGRPRHIHMSVDHPAHRTAITEVLFKGDPILGGEDPPNAIIVEEVRLAERRVLVGNFDVVLATS